MTDIKLLEELHSNTRRTRITYRAEVDGRPIAIKCYVRPAFGLVHWLRAQRRGKKIRRAGGPVPAIAYSGWVPKKRCFGFGTEFLQQYRSLRSVLREETNRNRQNEILQLLGKTMADLHGRGIEQPDGNLTNFLLGPGDRIQMVDEDDIRVYQGGLPPKVATQNLANVAARVLDDEMVGVILASYRTERKVGAQNEASDSTDDFWKCVADNRALLELKRSKKNLNAKRNFD